MSEIVLNDVCGRIRIAAKDSDVCVRVAKSFIRQCLVDMISAEDAEELANTSEQQQLLKRLDADLAKPALEQMSLAELLSRLEVDCGWTDGFGSPSMTLDK